MIGKDRVALITGAGGKIGSELALKMARNGVRMVLVDIAEEPLKAVAEKIAEYDTDVRLAAIDITDPEACKKAVDTAVETWGRLDILVNIAGIMTNSTIKKQTDETWNKTIDVNLNAPFYFTRAVYDIMKEQNYGRIINIASAAYHGAFGQASYAASKAALVSLTMTTSFELAKHHVTANVVLPGMVKSGITENVPDWMFEKATQASPLGRLCEASDVAAGIMFFADEDSEFYNGQILECTGGAGGAL